MAECYYIVDWDRRYEVDSKGRIYNPDGNTPKRSGKLEYVRWKVKGKSHGASYRRLQHAAGSSHKLQAAYALFGKLLEIAADTCCDARGLILNDFNTPANENDLVFFTGFPLDDIKTSLKILLDDNVRFIGVFNTENSDSAILPKLPQSFRNLRETWSPLITSESKQIISESYQNKTNQEEGNFQSKVVGCSSDTKKQKKKKTEYNIAGFNRFWQTWPKHQRKVAKEQCQKKWLTKGCEEMADDVITKLEQFKASEDWQKDDGQFIPAPLVWLNQAHWEGDPGKAGGPACTDAQILARMEADDEKKKRRLQNAPF